MDGSNDWQLGGSHTAQPFDGGILEALLKVRLILHFLDVGSGSKRASVASEDQAPDLVATLLVKVMQRL